MRKVVFRQSKALLTLIMLLSWVNVWSVSELSIENSDGDKDVEIGGDWGGGDSGNKSLNLFPISICCNSHYLILHDISPINTITVRITNQATGAMVFENVYPQGQTGCIVIPISNWDAGSYTIELFGRENNGYLWGTFQVFP